MHKVKKIIFILFMTISIIFIFGSCIYFGTRLVHFYLLENGDISKDDTNLNKILTSFLVTEEDGLHGENGEYYFYGKDVNNYILYSNRLFRILSIDIMGNIKIVSEDSITSIYNGEENKYIKKWLEDYYETLDKEYIVNTKYCNDKFDDILSCETEEEDNITLLTMKDYIKAGDTNSFLNNNQYYWLITSNSKNNYWYINNEGYSSLANTKVSLGVKPVITIKPNLDIISGDGSHDNPYIIEDTNIKELKDAYIGSYVLFSDRTWRIYKKDININLVLDEPLKDGIFSKEYNYFDLSIKNSLAYILNNDFYNSLDKEKILLNDWYNGYYEENYENVKNTSIKSYVGLNNIGDIFFNNDNIITITPTGAATKAIYVTDGNRIKISDIKESNLYKPVISISMDTLIESGNGTIISPYILK